MKKDYPRFEIQEFFSLNSISDIEIDNIRTKKHPKGTHDYIANLIWNDVRYDEEFMKPMYYSYSKDDEGKKYYVLSTKFKKFLHGLLCNFDVYYDDINGNIMIAKLSNILFLKTKNVCLINRDPMILSEFLKDHILLPNKNVEEYDPDNVFSNSFLRHNDFKKYYFDGDHPRFSCSSGDLYMKFGDKLHMNSSGNLKYSLHIVIDDVNKNCFNLYYSCINQYIFKIL